MYRAPAANLAAASAGTSSTEPEPHSAHIPARGDVRKSVKNAPVCSRAAPPRDGRRRGDPNTTGTSPPGIWPPGSDSAWNCREALPSTMTKSGRRVNGTRSEGYSVASGA